MPYKVIVDFKDLRDGAHAYKVGDTYPRENVEVSLGRIAELSSSANKRGIPLIEEVKEEVSKPRRRKRNK